MNSNAQTLQAMAGYCSSSIFSTSIILPLVKSQKGFGNRSENIYTWLNFFLDILLKQPEIVTKLPGSEDVEKLLSPKQLGSLELSAKVPGGNISSKFVGKP